jgi:hypothetical protein
MYFKEKNVNEDRAMQTWRHRKIAAGSMGLFLGLDRYFSRAFLW